jgi:hypothetical protein
MNLMAVCVGLIRLHSNARIVFAMFTVSSDNVLIDVYFGLHNSSSSVRRSWCASMALTRFRFSIFLLALNFSVRSFTLVACSNDRHGLLGVFISTLWLKRF